MNTSEEKENQRRYAHEKMLIAKNIIINTMRQEVKTMKNSKSKVKYGTLNFTRATKISSWRSGKRDGMRSENGTDNISVPSNVSGAARVTLLV